MNDKRVLMNIEDSIAVVTLNRPEKSNAFDGEMWLALEETAEKIKLNPDVKAVILTGAGKSFCGGLDINKAASEGINLQAKTLRSNYEALHYLSEVLTLYEKLPVPVIAAINGGCIGLGLELALACDIRLASEDAVFSIPEVVFGLVPDCGGTQRLPRLVGPAKAKELVYTGDRIDADEAKQIGLVNRVYKASELENATMQMAAKITGNSPEAVQASKRCINRALGTSLEAGLQYETLAAEAVLGEKIKTMIRFEF